MKQIILFLFIYNFTIAQSDVPLTLRAQFNGKYGYTIIGNTHNEFDNFQTNPSPSCQMLTQSSATLNLLPSQNITAAYLYWGGIGDGTFNANIQLNGIVYNSAQTFVGYPETNPIISCFNSFQNITNQVMSTGNGIYTFSNFNLNPIIGNYCSTSSYNSGWHILIIYNDTTLPNSQINIYDGITILSFYLNNGITPLIVDNLNIINTQSAKMTYVGLNGSPNLFFNESISVNGNVLSNAQNPPNNPLNGSNSFTGSNTNWNQDIDTFDISNYINIGNTQANISFNSFYYRFIQTLVTSIQSALPDATSQINQVTGQNICGNRNLVVSYKVGNNNSNAVLPANVPVSFYANNTLLQTTNTPASVAIGGFANFITTVSIPLSVPNTFDLRVVVDNSTTNTSTVAESNENNNEATQTITLSDITVTPTFTQITPICNGQTLNALPTISLNNISGSWTPALNNLATTSYTFTPNIGQCATTATMTIVVNPSITPFFTQVNPICSGATLSALPTISLNNISGSWTPLLNNLATTTYTFTPNTGQCATTATMTIVVNPSVTPFFTQVNPICSGATLSALPTISLNNISGNWTPALNNLSTTIYTFTPNTGQCATTATMTIVINPSITPTFTQITPICSGVTLSVLPTISLNNISGSWSPALNNLATTTYTFTPTAGQCATTATMTIVVNPSILPDFVAVTFCANDISFSLINQSPNGIVGTWSPPTIDFSANGFYTFMPNTGQCANSQTIAVTINQNSISDFDWTLTQPFTNNAVISINATPAGNYLYQLDFGPQQSSNIFQNISSGLHSVTVYDTNGCLTSITKNDILVIHYPLFFTPNGDGFNDTWKIDDLVLQPNAPIFIYDRYGKLLKQISTIGSGWDGTINGQNMPSDTYWFTIDYDFYAVTKRFTSYFALKR